MKTNENEVVADNLNRQPGKKKKFKDIFSPFIYSLIVDSFNKCDICPL